MASVSDYTKGFQRVVPNPALAALLAGGLLYGGSSLAYPWMKGALKHVASQLGMSDPESQADLEQNLSSDKYKKWLPVILGATGAAAVLGSSYNGSPALKWGGWFNSWSDPRRSVSSKGIAEATDSENRLHGLDAGNMYVNTEDKLGKTASDLFSWDINDQTNLDFGKLLPVRMSKDIILNDPHTELYQKGNALDIINNASGGSDTGRVSAGSLFDSALNKVQQNLTLSGITEAGIRALIGYGAAKAFTSTMCNLIDMPKPLRDGIVSAGMITNVIQGLD